MDHEPIRLTETVSRGGCAAKLPAGALRDMLGSLDMPRPAELAVGTATMDDACLWDLGDGRYLVQTLDFFTPIVDSPRDFGAIAAANAMSDVFAMGGRPSVALTIMGFPAAKLPMELMRELMAGALEAITAAGACLGGGHTIDDETLKLGFAVTGFVDKECAWTNAGALPGDALILTKPLGTGTITSALKSKKAQDDWITGAIRSMRLLNDTAGLLDGVTVHAATDVTGFGLAGHALQMARASGVGMVIDASCVPSLPGARECLKAGILNRAHHSNKQYVASSTKAENLAEDLAWLMVDPQTSGGLLLAVAPADADRAVNALKMRFADARQIGAVVEAQEEPRLVLRT